MGVQDIRRFLAMHILPSGHRKSVYTENAERKFHVHKRSFQARLRISPTAPLEEMQLRTGSAHVFHGFHKLVSKARRHSVPQNNVVVSAECTTTRVQF